MQSIRIDDEVMNEIENRARDSGVTLLMATPNDALRAIFELDAKTPVPTIKKRRRRSASARVLLREHQDNEDFQGVKSAYYHLKGSNYTKPRDDQFPVVFFDPNGYVVIKSKREFNTSRFSVSNGVYVADGISALKNYENCGHLHTR